MLVLFHLFFICPIITPGTVLLCHSCKLILYRFQLFDYLYTVIFGLFSGFSLPLQFIHGLCFCCLPCFYDL